MIAGPPVGALPVIAVRTEIHQQMTEAAATARGEVVASMPLRVVEVTGSNVHGIGLRREMLAKYLLELALAGVADWHRRGFHCRQFL